MCCKLETQSCIYTAQSILEFRGDLVTLVVDQEPPIKIFKKKILDFDLGWGDLELDTAIDSADG